MRLHAYDPNVIVAQALVPNVNIFKETFTAATYKLRSRVSAASNPAVKMPGVTFFSPFLPDAIGKFSLQPFYDKAA
ncbi:MAG: hypothetical protein RIM72_22970 [Alphaproteobacteria bacterium]